MSLAKRRIAEHIGSLLIVSEEQRDEIQRIDEALIQSYRCLAEVIRSGQLPQEAVPGLLEQNPDFARWYKENRL